MAIVQFCKKGRVEFWEDGKHIHYNYNYMYFFLTVRFEDLFTQRMASSTNQDNYNVNEDISLAIVKFYQVKTDNEKSSSRVGANG